MSPPRYLLPPVTRPLPRLVLRPLPFRLRLFGRVGRLRGEADDVAHLVGGAFGPVDEGLVGQLRQAAVDGVVGAVRADAVDEGAVAAARQGAGDDDVADGLAARGER